MTAADVVIAGGGPTGLMLAGELALGGVTPIVLDSSPGPNPEPRANGVSGTAVRFLDHRGLYEELTGSSEPPRPSPVGMFSGLRLDLSGTPSSQYLLPVQQPRLARTLAERAGHIGVEMRWGHSLRGFTPQQHGVVVEVDGPDGPYQINADYLVGADGGHSATRKLAGIAFPGMSSNDAVFRVGRGLMPPAEWRDPATGALNIPGHGPMPAMTFLRAGTGMFLWGQWEGLSLLGTLELAATPDNTRTDSEHAGFGDPLTTAELEDSLSRVLGVRVPVQPAPSGGEVVLRRFSGINSRAAERYRQDRVFLVGDAAHVHSPLGGPGLNLCLQDAANLGWKLAAVVRGRVDPKLLGTYEPERKLAAKQVLIHSRAQLALMRPGPEITALRELLGDLLQEAAVTRQLADTLSGTAVRYPTQPDDHPAVGHWVPDITVGTPAHGDRSIAQLARDGRPLLLDFTKRSTVAETLDGTGEAIAVVPGRPTEPVELTAVLVRPDGYVAWASSEDDPDTDTLNRALEYWFGVTVREATARGN
ncbi:MAG: FAD-dependent monooxygenase [Mycobacterium sp.]|uniref:FAD-dependent monooxygenase n=1 Tax=Mycobacterium sp. TaxID=1785 RepID=UPI003CC59BC1